MYTKLITIILLFCSTLYIGATNNNDKKHIHPVKELQVINPNLFSLLDTVIIIQAKTNVFKYGTHFEIGFVYKEYPGYIVIIPLGDRMDSYQSDIRGYVEYKKNIFFVTGDTLDTTIFRKTTYSRNFDFSPRKSTYIKNGEIIFDSYAILEFYPFWFARYQRKHFKLYRYGNEFWNKGVSFYTDIEYEPLQPIATPFRVLTLPAIESPVCVPDFKYIENKCGKKKKKR